jgi:acetyltransferase
VTLRPVVVEDLEQAHSAFAGLSEQTRYFRYQRAVPKLTAELIVESVTPHTKPSVILVATVREGNVDRLVGGGRIEAAGQEDEARGPKRRVAEFAVIVVDAWQSKGIGAALLRSLCRRARAMGYRELVGDVLAVNTPMLALTARLGFTIQERSDPGEVVRVRRVL